MSNKALTDLRALVNEQAEEEGLWFIADTVIEAFFQQELRRLHAAVERALASLPEGAATRAQVDSYYLPTTKPYGDEVKIQRARQLDGSLKWSVRFQGDCLNRQGKWEWEPMPSSRDDEFIARCRFDSAQEAIDAAQAAAIDEATKP